MSNDHPKRESMSLEDATVATQWEISEMVVAIERKDLVHTTPPGGGVHFLTSS
jgi:hypothetical protein